MGGSVQPATSSGPDVTQLATESLTRAPFPVCGAVAFRVHFEPQAYAGMTAHAREDVSVEICGVLVGDWGRDDDGPFVTVRDFIRCDSAAKKFAEVTFTHDSWSHINREMDTRFQDQRIVGWYHSHPNFGIFLSDRDLFIQQNFFSGPGQIAFVIDPVRKIEGVFEWSGGKAIPTPHFWVGSQVQLAPLDSDITGVPEGPLDAIPIATRRSHSAAEYGPAPTPWNSTFSMALTFLAGVGLFFTGWMLASNRTLAERRALAEGTVAHFGIWGLLRPGLEEELFGVEKGLSNISDQLKILATTQLKQQSDAAGEKEDSKAADRALEDWKKTLDATADLRAHVRHIQRLYSLTPEERQAIRMINEQKLVELTRMAPSPDRSAASSGAAVGADVHAGDHSHAEKSPSSITPEKSKTSKSQSP